MEIEVRIRGMTCAACVSTLERRLNAIHGISNVSISLVTEKGIILCDPSHVSTDDVLNAIEDIGFNGTLLAERSENQNIITVCIFFY